MYRSFYLNVSWAQRLFYKGVSMFIDPETKIKLVMSGESAPKAMVDFYHPS